MRVTSPKGAALLLLPVALLCGCHGTLWTRPVIWLDPNDAPGQQVNGDFTMAFATMESCEGLTLQSQGIPKSPRWILHLASTSPATDATEPVAWTLSHAEEPGVSFHNNATNPDESVRQVCALVKQQGKK